MEYNYSTSYGTTATSGSSEVSGAVMLVLALIFLVIFAVLIVSMWRIFTKAGKPGWAALVPIYNTYILYQIIGRPAWWILLLFVPVVNTIVGILVAIDLARAFGKSTTFGVVGLLIFPLIGYPMLAFGSSVYNGGSPTDLAAMTGTPPNVPTPSAAATTPNPTPPTGAPTPPTPPTTPTA